MTTQTKPMTAEELAQLPDDGWRYELVEESCTGWPQQAMNMVQSRCGLAGDWRNMWKRMGLGVVYAAEDWHSAWLAILIQCGRRMYHSFAGADSRHQDWGRGFGLALRIWRSKWSRLEIGLVK